MNTALDIEVLHSEFNGKVVSWHLSFDLKAKSHYTLAFNNKDDKNTKLYIDVAEDSVPIALQLVNYKGLPTEDGDKFTKDERIAIAKDWYRMAVALVAQSFEEQKEQRALIRSFVTDYYDPMNETYAKLLGELKVKLPYIERVEA